MLYSSTPSSQAVEGAQRRLADLLAALRVHPRLVDGASAANRDARAALWALPGATRAAYPQLFVETAAADGGAPSVECLGDAATVQAMAEGAQHLGVRYEDGALARRLEGCV